MDTKTYFEKLKQNPLPMVVDFWAPWCGPCKMVKPILEKLGQEYSGRVEIWQVNADENQDLLRELKIYGIPTLIVYRDGKEVARQVGAKSAGSLRSLLEILSTGGTPGPVGLTSMERFIRLGLGIAVAGLGWAAQGNWLFLLTGGILMFSAVYDRCPIWRALTSQLKKLAAKAKA